MSDPYQQGKNFMPNQGEEKARDFTKKPVIGNSSGKNSRTGSKTAPVDQEFNFLREGTDTDPDEYLRSYNYFIYYNSITPKDPRLPKPTYNGNSDLDFVKEGRIKEEDEHGLDINEQFNDPNLGMNNNNVETLNSMMGNLNLQSDLGGMPPVNSNNFYDDINPFGTNFDNSTNMQMPGLIGNKLSAKNQSIGQKTQKGKNPQNMGPGWNDPNPNIMGGMNMNMPINPMNNNIFFDGGNSGIGMGLNQSPYQNKKQKKGNKKNNMGNNMNNMNPSLFNQNAPFDPMNFQNPGLYNSYYNNPSNNNSGNHGINYGNNLKYPNYQKNMMENFGGFEENQSNPFGLMSMGMGNMGMGLNGLNMPLPNLNLPPNMGGMGFNMGGIPNMGMPGGRNNNFNQKGSRKNKNNNNDGNYAAKKELVEPPSLEDIIENAVEFSKDHSGSRLLQKKYEEASQEDRDKLFAKLQPEILPLSKDLFGNYAIQKVLEFKEPEKNKIILDALKTKIYDLSLHMYGCRVIQQLITVIDDEYIPQITSELSNYFAKCIEDQNGNHVIQKLIERLHPGEKSGIYDVVLANIFDLSIHQYGCRVIQKLFNQCDEEQKERLLEEIYKNVIELCQDQYGNYVIQYVLEKQKGIDVQQIYDDLKGRIFEMSIHKFASNVIEKALSYGTVEQRSAIINEIISKDDLVHDSLLSMVKDKFGNYVVQKMIEYSDQKTKENIIKRIISSQSLKKRDGFSKHVINFIEKMGFSAGQIKQNTNNPSQVMNPNIQMGGMSMGPMMGNPQMNMK